MGAVFRTSSEGEENTIWIVTKHGSSTYHVEFARFTPKARTWLLKIAVKPKGSHRSYVEITYTYTGVTLAGNDFIDHFTQGAFLDAVTFWEKSMNRFLETGMRLKNLAASYEVL